MCRRNFLGNALLASAFLMTTKPVRLHKSVWRKNEYSCFSFRHGAIRRPESLRNSKAGVTSSRKDGPGGAGAQRRSFHGGSSRPEERSGALPLKAKRIGSARGES